MRTLKAFRDKTSEQQDIVNQLSEYLTYYNNYIKDSETIYNKIENHTRKRRKHNLSSEIEDMISKINSTKVIVLDTTQSQENRQIIRCVVDGLVASVSALEYYQTAYTNKLNNVIEIIEMLKNIISASNNNINKEDTTTTDRITPIRKVLSSILEILTVKLQKQQNSLEKSNNSYIVPQQKLVDEYYRTYPFLSGPESAYSKKSPSVKMPTSTKSKNRSRSLTRSNSIKSVASLPNQ
jgi:hypothetical protein